MQKRNILNSPRLLELKRHRQKVVLRKILISLFGLLAVFLLLAYLSRLDRLNINQIEIVGNKIVDTQIIEEMVKKQIAGKYLWLFPKTNVLIYPENNIKNELQNKFKRLRDVNLSIKNNKTLEVSLTERVAKYTWCGTAPDLEAELLNSLRSSASNQKCYFLDENGYVFDEAPYFSGEVYFKFYGASNLGSYFSKQNFKQLISFKDILISLGLKPIAFYITNDEDIQIFLSGGTSLATAPKIMLKADADFQNIAENLEAALTTEPLQSKFKNKYSSLEYIDLRFGNKVYDKFK